jgi:hypothetical protein
MSDQVQVRGPDGQMFRFPASMPQEQITGVLDQHYGRAPASPSRQQMGRLEAASEGLADSFSLGFNDEAAGALAAAETGPRGWRRFTDGEGSFLGDLGGAAWDTITAGSPMVRGAVEGAIGFTPEQTQAYEGTRDSRRASLEQAQQEAPLWTLGGQVVGGILNAALTGGMGVAATPARGVSLLGRTATIPAMAARTVAPTIGRAAAVGAGYGGAYGFGSGESMDDRLSSAGIGALVGAPAAVLGQAAASGIGNALRGVARRVMPSAFSNPERRAVDRVTRRLVQDRVSPAQARQSIADMQAVGVERPSIMEASPSVRGLGRVIADQPGDMVGDSGRRFGDFIETRMQDMPGAIRGQLDNAFIPQSYRLTFPDEVVSQYETAVRQQAGPFFQQVRGAVSGQNRTLQQLLRTPSGQRAFRQASLVARDRGMPFVDVYDEAGGLIDDMPDLDINFLHLVRQQLDDMSGVATRQGAPRGTSGITSVRQRLDRIMKDASPELRQADQFYSTLMRGSEGARIGQRFDNLGPARTLREWVRTATPEQLMLARIQAANRLGGRIQDMANPTTQLRSGGNRLEAIRALFGSQSAADDFARHIEAQRQIARTMQEVSGGSMTSRNLAQQDYEGMQLVAEGLGDFASGGGVLTVLRQSAARLIRRMPFGRMGDAERRALIDILTETDPERLALIFGEIGRAQASVSAVQSVSSAVPRVAGATASQSVAPAINAEER